MSRGKEQGRIVEPGSWRETASKSMKHYSGVMSDVEIGKETVEVAYEAIRTLLMPRVVDGKVVSEPAGELRIINKDYKETKS